MAEPEDPQFFSVHPDCLPELLYPDDVSLPARRVHVSGANCLQFRKCLIGPQMARQIRDPRCVDAVFKRVLDDKEKGAWILGQLDAWVAMSDPSIVEQCARFWCASSDPAIRREIVHWLSGADPTIAKRELFKAYCTEPVPEERGRIGQELILAGEEFCILFEREQEEGVRVALIRAEGSLRADASLQSMEHAYDVGLGVASEPIVEAVREQVAYHLDFCHCDVARRLHERVGKQTGGNE